LCLILVAVIVASFLWEFGYQAPGRPYEWFIVKGDFYFNAFPPNDPAPAWAFRPGYYLAPARQLTPLFEAPSFSHIQAGRWHLTLPLWLPTGLLTAYLAYPVVPLVLRRSRQRMAQCPTAEAQRNAAPFLTAQGRPDWTGVEYDVACPHCGYNLRGLADARCPECGITFDWRAILSTSAGRIPWLFEHAWAHQPARSFFRTLLHACVPWRFWRDLRATDDVRVRPLIGFFLLWTLALFVLWQFWLFFVSTVRPNTSISFDVRMLDGVGALIAGNNPPRGLLTRFLLPLTAWIHAILTLLTWLLVGRVFMRLPIRPALLLRVLIYGMSPLLIGVLWGFIQPFAVQISTPVAPTMSAGWYTVLVVLPLSGWLFTCLSWILGLRVYLSVRNAWLIVLASQLVFLVVVLGLSP
jgi:hypothetical protein